MAKMFRIGVLGLTHDHVWSNLDELIQCPNGEIIAAADPNAPLLDKCRQQFNCNVYESYETMLASESLDAVYVYSDNASGAELVQMAANKGLHMMIEKPLAATLAGADQIIKAVKENDVRLMVNWPFAWWPALRHALHLAQQGEIGRVWQVKYRAAHAGPKELGCSDYFCDWLFDAKRNGGGALIDYCCYGAVLARTLLGMPQKILASAGRLCKENISVEDNAVILMEYPKASAVAEASWTQIGKMTSYITVIYGTVATLLVEPRKNGRLLLANKYCPDGKEIEVPEVPAADSNATLHFVDCLETGMPFYPLCQILICRDTQEILETAKLSLAKRNSLQ